MKLTNTTKYPDYMLRRLVSWCCKQLDIPVKSIRKATFKNAVHTGGLCYSARGEIIIRLAHAMEWSFEDMNDYAIARANEMRVRNGHEPFADPVHILVKIGRRLGGGEVTERALAVEKVATRNAENGPARFRALVDIVAHEVAHRANYLHGSTTRDHRRQGAARRVGGGSERQTCLYERKLMTAFDANRLALTAQWLAPPKRRTATETAPKSRQQVNHQRTLSALERWQRKLKLAQGKVAKLKHRIRYYERAAARKAEANSPPTNGA